MRSLTEPNGFWLSSFAIKRTLGLGDKIETSTNGVLPMSSREFCSTNTDPPFLLTSAIDMCLLRRPPIGPTNETQTDGALFPINPVGIVTLIRGLATPHGLPRPKCGKNGAVAPLF